MGRDDWGVTFAEHMGGFFQKGATDPMEGFRQGKAQGAGIDFRVRIRAEPLTEFMSVPEHGAAMDGRFWAAGLGQGLPIRAGEFNMFPGDEGSGLRHITYRFGFDSADGERFFFSGIKNIHLARRERSRTEPVTLYSRVHRGDSEDGEVYGAGILLFNTLSLDGFQLLFSLRVTGARSVGEKLKALRMFAGG